MKRTCLQRNGRTASVESAVPPSRLHTSRIHKLSEGCDRKGSRRTGGSASVLTLLRRPIRSRAQTESSSLSRLFVPCARSRRGKSKDNTTATATDGGVSCHGRAMEGLEDSRDGVKERGLRLWLRGALCKCQRSCEGARRLARVDECRGRPPSTSDVRYGQGVLDDVVAGRPMERWDSCMAKSSQSCSLRRPLRSWWG